MKPKTEKIVIFIALFIFIFMLLSILTNYILPVKTSMISVNIGKYSNGEILFYSESESYNINDYILYVPTSKQFIVIAQIAEINPDGTFKVLGYNPESIVDLDQNDLKQEQIIGKVIYSIPMYIFYPIVITITIILAYILTIFIIKRLKAKKKDSEDLI